MNRTAVKKVIVALRSGEYKKCTYQLAKKKKGEDTYGAFCVWGVVTDQYAKAHRIKRGTAAYRNLFEYETGGVRSYPRLVVREWIKLPHAFYHELIRLNDAAKLSFPELAIYMEKLIKEEKNEKPKAKKTPKTQC